MTNKSPEYTDLQSPKKCLDQCGHVWTPPARSHRPRLQEPLLVCRLMMLSSALADCSDLHVTMVADLHAVITSRL